MMDSHKLQLKKNPYRIWVKAGLALKYLKDGIEDFVDEEVKSQQSTILDEVWKDLGKRDVICVECDIETLLPAHKRVSCLYGNRCFCRSPKRKACPKDVCGRIFDKIVQHHMHGKPSWSNTDATKWCENHWEIAKCFLDGRGYEDKTNASETDCKGLLSIITNNMFVQRSVDTPIDKLEPKTDVFSKCKEARNEILHLASLELTELQLKCYIDVMIQVLKDQGRLKDYESAKHAITKLRQLEQKNLVISTEDEFEIRESALKAIQEKKQQALDEIDDRETQKENFEKLQNQVSQLQETLDLLSSADSNSSLLSRQESLENRQTLLDDTLKQIQQVQSNTPKEILDLQKDVSDLKSRLKSSSELEDLHKKKLAYLRQKKELREELFRLYSKYLSTMTVSPLLMRLHASVDDFYMELEICDDLVYERHENRSSGYIIKDYRDIFYKTILTQEEDGSLRKTEKRVENIYVLGDAGAGKSTWCLKLINMWLKGFDEKEVKLNKNISSNEKMMLEFDVVFFVALRHASDEKDIIDMISNQIFDQAPRFQDHSQSVLMEEPEKCLVLVDGLDEWKPPGVQSSSLFGKTSKLPGRRQLNHCTVLTTTRPWKLNEVKPSYNIVDRAVIIKGFEHKNSIRVLAGKVIDKLAENDEKSDKNCNENEGSKHVSDFEFEVKELFNMTNSNNDYPDLMKIPLILIFMVLRWFKEGALEKTMTCNYSSLLENILDHEEGYKRYGQVADYDGRLSTISDIDQAKHEWSAKSDLLPECLKERAMYVQYSGIFLKLSKIGFDGLFDNQLIFTEKEILEKLTPVELEVSVKSGILSKTSIIGGSSYEMSKLSFLHKTVQEYMAALFMSADMKDGNSRSFEKFKEFCDTYDKIYEMENVIMFACGLDSNLGSKLINYISVVERGRMTLNEYDQIPTHFYNKCFREFIVEPGKQYAKLQLNAFLLEQWCHAKDFFELLKASDDKITFGKICCFFESEMSQPKLMDFFPPLNPTTSNLTTLVIESVTMDCSNSVIVLELNKLERLNISHLDCKCLETDVDKDLRCCLYLDFTNSNSLETARISNVSMCKVSLSGRSMLELTAEYLMLCHIDVYTGILKTTNENHTFTKENKSVEDSTLSCDNHTINSIEMVNCQKSEIVLKERNNDQVCLSVDVSFLIEINNRQCEVKNVKSDQVLNS